jgi:hypothetical protein
MTRDELVERFRKYPLLLLWIVVPAGVVMVLTAAVGLRLWSVLLEAGPGEADGTAEREARARALWWVQGIIVAVGVLLLLLVAWGHRWAARRLGLACASCGASLTPKRYSRAALGPGTCVRCGARVVEDAPTSVVTTRAEPGAAADGGA